MYHLQASPDRSTLTANWTGGDGHQGLRGGFSGTLNGSGTAYSGTLHVTEGSTSANGTMTFTIRAADQLSVSYQQSNGPQGTFTLVRRTGGPPQLGLSAKLSAVAGQVLVRPAGSATFIPLSRAQNVPVGSTVDVTAGTVALTTARTASPSGGRQTGRFSKGVFMFSQSTSSAVTTLTLIGGTFAAARTLAVLEWPASDPAASIARRRVLRRLQGSAHGRFRTLGRYAAAMVHGTVWTTIDRCDGTVIAVRRGVVRATDLRRHRSRSVRAGQRFVAQGPPQPSC